MRIFSVLLLGAVLLGGCSAAPGEDNASQTPGPEVSQTEISQPESAPSDELPDQDYSVLESTAKLHGRTPEMTEGIEVVRKIKPEEWQQAHESCLNDFGYFASPNGDWGVPEEQWQALGIATYSCLVMYPVQDKYTKKNGEPELLRYYEYWRDTVLPCLKEKGYETNELPSFEVFTATAGTEKEYHPIGDVDEEFSTTRWEEATEVCHVLPSADYILGFTDTP